MLIKSAIFAYIHYLSFALMAVSLTLELLIFKAEVTLKDAKKLLFADTVYGLAAIAIVASGVLRLLYYAKGSEYYTANPIFWVKMGLLIVVSLLSLYPTISYLRWIPAVRKDEAPTVSEVQGKLIPNLIRAELAGLALIPITATLMARGIGLS
jgi:putative membrane protein